MRPVRYLYMETSQLTERASRTAGDLKSMLQRRSTDLLKRTSELRDRAPVVARPRRPRWQTGAMWFAGGLALAAALGYFFDSQRGSVRRRMAYDRGMAVGRDMQRWSGGKVRHLRNRAMGTAAEMRGMGAEMESERKSTRELG